MDDRMELDPMEAAQELEGLEMLQVVQHGPGKCYVTCYAGITCQFNSMLHDRV